MSDLDLTIAATSPADADDWRSMFLAYCDFYQVRPARHGPPEHPSCAYTNSQCFFPLV